MICMFYQVEADQFPDYVDSILHSSVDGRHDITHFRKQWDMISTPPLNPHYYQCASKFMNKNRRNGILPTDSNLVHLSQLPYEVSANT